MSQKQQFLPRILRAASKHLGVLKNELTERQLLEFYNEAIHHPAGFYRGIGENTISEMRSHLLQREQIVVSYVFEEYKNNPLFKI